MFNRTGQRPRALLGDKMAKKTQTRNSKKGTKKTSSSLHHPDHSRQLHKLNRVEGQLAGVKKMIEERRYCPDIIQQVRATRKALFSVESALLSEHLEHCVSDALDSKIKSEKENKLAEILKIFKSADSQGIEF